MTWEELRTEVYTLTARSDLVAETDMAIRNAIRTAHKSGRYWRDLTEVLVSGLPTDEQIQEISLDNWAPRFRQMVNIAPADNTDRYLTPVSIDDLLDLDGYARTDVYWGFGTSIRIRAASPVESYVLQYVKYPVVSPAASLDSWIANEHTDLIALWAAMTVLNTIGEQEIRSRLEPLAALALADLQQDNLEIQIR